MKLALLNIRKNIKNEKELKSSFIISIIGMMLNNIAFIFLWYYFGKTVGNINGWEPVDIFGLYAFTTTSYGIIASICAGIFRLPDYISGGTLDKYFLTPKNILLKVTTSSISTSAIGDFFFGIVCFIIFIIFSKLTILQILLAIFLMIIASIIYYSCALVCMSISFYLMDGHNVSNGLFSLLLSNSLYHGGAFTGLLRIIFIYIVPSLLLGAVPVEIVKHFNIYHLLLIIILAIFWFIFSIIFFYKSLKKYESNNLFGFGN